MPGVRVLAAHACKVPCCTGTHTPTRTVRRPRCVLTRRTCQPVACWCHLGVQVGLGLIYSFHACMHVAWTRGSYLHCRAAPTSAPFKVQSDTDAMS